MPGGTVDIQSNGQLDLEQGSASQGAAFIDESNGDLRLGQLALDTTTTITGSGFLDLGGQVLPANYAFTGSTQVDGPVQVDGSLAGSQIEVGSDASGSSLSGTGTVGPLSVADADVSPGDDGDPGVLNVQGPADFTGAFDDEVGEEPASLTVELNGPTAGTGYSQLNVNGAVTLEACSLSASLGFIPENGEPFTIIKSTAPIEGTFTGLPEGASLTIGDTPFTISYRGGDGNDVVLTAGTPAVAAPPTVTGLSPSSGPAAGGTSVTITGTGFTGATAVDFGTTAATDVVVVNDTTITADSPAGSGVADVTVTTPVGTSATLPADQFTYIAAAPDLVLTGGAPDTLTLGNSVTYTLTVTNNGTASATGVTLTDTLPSGAAFVSATGGAKPTGGVLTFALGSLDAGADASVTIVVTPTAAGPLSDTAAASMDQTDPTPDDNSVTLPTAVNAIAGTADLTLSPA